MMDESNDDDDKHDSPTLPVKEIEERNQITLEASTKNSLRRSTRNPSKNVISSSNFQDLVQKLKTNHDDVVVLQCRKYLPDPDTSSKIIDAMLTALESNKNCQALYIHVRDSNKHFFLYYNYDYHIQSLIQLILNELNKELY